MARTSINKSTWLIAETKNIYVDKVFVLTEIKELVGERL